MASMCLVDARGYDTHSLEPEFNRYRAAYCLAVGWRYEKQARRRG
jgi:hypothetical protein